MRQVDRLTFLAMMGVLLILGQVPIRAQEPVPATPSPPAEQPTVVAEPTPVAEVVAPIPEEIASPAGASVEIPKPPLVFQTPFSLNDCMNLVGATMNTLPTSNDVPLEYSRDSYLRLLEAVSNYLKDRDDLHFTWIGYKWEDVARRRVSGGLIEQIKVPFEGVRIPRRTSAISFVVENGDVYLHSLKVWDMRSIPAEGDPPEELAIMNERFDEPVVMRHSLPRWAVFHLLRPTDIGMVDMAVSRVDPESDRTPRIVMKVGSTDKPEHVKAAIWYIIQAEKALKNDNWIEARQHLNQTRQEIQRLRTALRLDR